MTEPNWLDMCEKLILDARPAGKGGHALILWRGDLQLIPTVMLLPGDIVIAVFSSRDINEGPMCSRWGEISNKLRQITGGKPL